LGRGFSRIWSAIRGSDWVFMPGGNNVLGVLGQVGAVLELAEQIACGDAPDINGIVVAQGSGCTVTGLVFGVALSRAKGLPAFRRPGFRIYAQPVHPLLARMHAFFGFLTSQSWPLTIGRGLREVASLLVSAGGPDIAESALRVMHDELIINTDMTIAGKYGAHSKASREAKVLYDESVEASPGVPHLWLCGHFSAKGFALLLRVLGEDGTGDQKRLLFWETKSAVQPLGQHDEWKAFEAQRQSSRALAEWAVLGGIGGTGHPHEMGKTDSERKVTGADEYRHLMTPVALK